MSQQRTELSHGVRVVTERHPYSKALSVGFFVDQGTRDEASDLVGAAHFVEHMVFKGTARRDALEISKSLEKLGGELNAYTSREESCFYATCLSEHLPVALDVLSDLLLDAQFPESEFLREREVINQEILMTRDDSEEHIYDVFYEEAYEGHPLARSILGTQESLAKISRARLKEFYRKRYYGSNLVVAVTGQVDHEEICRELESALKTRRKSPIKQARKKPRFKSFSRAIRKEGEQCHLMVGLPYPSAKAKDRFAGYILNTALGGGMTSRLYQKIREKKGLCYSVYSNMQSNTDSGLLGVYAGTTGENLKKVTGMVTQEIHRLMEKGLGVTELRDFKRQVCGEILLEAESVENRMQAIGSQELLFSNSRPVEQIVQDVEAVSGADIKSFCQKYLGSRKMGLVVIGDRDEDSTKTMLDSYR